MAEQTVSIPFGSGVDTKTDPKMLPSPKLTLLQDGIFTNAQRVTKRPGYDGMTTALVGGGVWSSPKMTLGYRDELLLAASTSNGPRLLSYSEALTAWEDKGKYVSASVSKQTVNAGYFTYPAESTIPTRDQTYGSTNSSSAVSGNIGLFAFDYFANWGLKDTVNATYITVVDLETGTHLADSVQITNAVGFSKAILLGTSTLAVFYISSAAVNRLAFRIITITAGGGVVVGSEITVGTCAALATLTNPFPYVYDLSTTATGAIIAVANRPNLNLYTITTSGVVSAATTIASTGDITPLTTSLDSSGRVWVYWVSASVNIYYAVYSSSLTLVLGATAVLLASSLPFGQLSAIPTTTNGQTVYYTSYNYIATTLGTIIPGISNSTVTSTGTVGSSSSFIYGCDLFGKYFTQGGRTYLPCITLSQSASTGFIVDVADSVAVAKFLQNECEGIYRAGNGHDITVVTAAKLIAGRMPGFINSAYTLPSGAVGIAAGFVISLSQASGVDANNLGVGYLLNTYSINAGVAFSIINFSDQDSYQGLIQQDTAVFNGGILNMYDGASSCELGFSVDPDNIGASALATGGSLAAATYIYYVTWEWTDANGNLYQSAPSIGIQVVITTGTTNSVFLQMPQPRLTSKSGVIVKLWRSDSSQGGGIAYLVGISPLLNTSAPFIIFTDTVSNATAITYPTLYTQNNAVLENIAPPPSMILWTNNKRLWCIASENPETNIEYTKTESLGTGISFSTGQLEYLVDSKNGAMTGASPMDEKTVILKENGAGYFIGDGANDSGTGSTLSNFQFVPSDTGCSNSKSVVLYPGGILFRATNNKGIYQFSRGVQINYFGYPVSDYASQDITSAKIMGNRNQLRFLTSSGFSICYDYVMNQWSVFTNHTGLSADIFNGGYVYVRTDGSVYTENATSYLDNGVAYAPILILAWIKAQSIQGFQRSRRIALLGDFSTANGGHGVQISIAYDFVPTFSSVVPYYFVGANGTYQYRERLNRQKCDSMQLMIQEITTGATGEYIDFSDLGLEIMAKNGLNKLPGSSSVGG